jgi:hypothetical protein
MNTQKNEKIKKNYPGYTRTPGTKDYALILSSLMSRRNTLIRSENPEEITELFLIISQKLQELGFQKQATSIKLKVKRKVNITYKWKEDRFENIDEKKEGVVNTATECWTLGKEKQDLAKAKKKKN